MHRNRNMGRALSVMVRAEVDEIVMHEDVSAFGAPSECHRDVSRGEDRRRRIARRLAKSLSGLSRAEFNNELRRSAGVGGRVWQNAISRVYAARSPFAYR